MDKSVLIAGKDFPSSAAFVNAGVKAGYAAAVSVSQDEKLPGDTLCSFNWNRHSSVSAHTFILEAVNTLKSLSHALLIFDAKEYEQRFSDFDTQTISEVTDEAVAGYMFLTKELLEFFSKREAGGTLCFLYQPSFAAKEIKSFAKNKDSVPTGRALVAAASAAFKAFAENTAALHGYERIKIMLAEYDESEEQNAQTQTAETLFAYLNAYNTSDKYKQSIRWIKLGTKAPAPWQLFKH